MLIYLIYTTQEGNIAIFSPPMPVAGFKPLIVGLMVKYSATEVQPGKGHVFLFVETL
jgi:hypothetical protein